MHGSWRLSIAAPAATADVAVEGAGLELLHRSERPMSFAPDARFGREGVDLTSRPTPPLALGVRVSADDLERLRKAQFADDLPVVARDESGRVLVVATTARDISAREPRKPLRR